MELGIVALGDLQHDPATGRPRDAEERLAQIVDYAVVADQEGLDVFGVGEHHTLDFVISSPAVVLAAVAARTRQIRLTTAVTVLPVHDPVRVYQDFATVDLLSRGRAELTVGRSAYVEPFEIFGQDTAHYDELFSEKLELLLRLRADDHVTWRGRFRTPLEDAPITPRAAQSPLPVWVGVGGSRSSAERAGRLGLPMILGYIGGPLSQVRRTIDVYRAAGAAAGHEQDLQVGISSHFFAAASDSAASDIYPYYHEYLRPKTPGGRGFVVEPAAFEAGRARGQAIMIGSAEQLVEKIVDARQTLGIDRFYGQTDWGGMPSEMVAESIHRFATEIAPAVRAAV